MTKKAILIIVLIIAFLGIGFASFVMMKNSNNSPVNPGVGQVACTMEAKLCPDGSYVGRSGPNCEFAACPDGTPKEDTVAGLNQRIFNNGVYITPITVSDSRCPTGVECIWAGEVSIKVHLEKDTVTKDMDLKLAGSISFGGSTIYFTDVVPKNKTKGAVPDTDYKFTFKVTPSSTVLLSQNCPPGYISPDPNCATN